MVVKNVQDMLFIMRINLELQYYNASPCVNGVCLKANKNAQKNVNQNVKGDYSHMVKFWHFLL